MPSPPELLAQVPLFQELEAADLSRIADATQVRTFPEGEHIFEIGEPGRSLYIVTGGTVQVLHPSRHENFQLAQLGPGEFFGEMALLNDAPRSATARAICDVETLVLDKSDFRQLIQAQPEVALKLLEVMSIRMRHADDQISGLSNQAVRDQLTGLFNKQAFNDRLAEEIARWRRYDGSFSLILIDLVRFGSVNEAVGEARGDEILAWMGRLLNEHTRASDVPFRFEEDIFAIFCPRTESEVAASVGARLVALVGEAKPPIDESVTLTLSAGSATCPDDAQDAHALYHHAQRALLTAKALVI